MSAFDPQVRPARAEDVPAVVGLVHELAAYERASEQCNLTEEQLETALFCAHPSLFGHVATVEGRVVACALWFLNFSTWEGVHGMYIEDLYVQPTFRRHGVGRSLLRELARECHRRGFARLQWAVLDWNEPAISFYRSLGAVAEDEWTIFRLTGVPLRSLA